LGILKELGELDRYVNCTDFLPKQYCFDTRFKVVIPDRTDWFNTNLPIEENSLVWYTDGSRMEDNSGLGIYGPNCNISQGLGTYPSVFQAEVLAIHFCAEKILAKGMKGAKFYIMSDSQAALKSLIRPKQVSKMVWECRETLQKLALHNKLTLMWVPGHEGIDGNERADELARKGSKTQFTGPEPFCALPTNTIYEPIKLWESKRLSFYWTSLTKLRQAKRLISPYNIKDVLNLEKHNLRVLTGLLTGHCTLRYHMHKLGLNDQPTCRLCLEEDETSEHIMCHCEAITRLRLNFLGKLFLTPKDIHSTPPRDILRFIKNLNII
jgi:ribonuclease HI